MCSKLFLKIGSTLLKKRNQFLPRNTNPVNRADEISLYYHIKHQRYRYVNNARGTDVGWILRLALEGAQHFKIGGHACHYRRKRAVIRHKAQVG